MRTFTTHDLLECVRELMDEREVLRARCEVLARLLGASIARIDALEASTPDDTLRIVVLSLGQDTGSGEGETFGTSTGETPTESPAATDCREEEEDIFAQFDALWEALEDLWSEASACKLFEVLLAAARSATGGGELPSAG